MTKEKKILVFGGEKDFNLARFIPRCQAQGHQVLPVLFSQAQYPIVDYNLITNSLTINDELIDVDTVLIRYNTFEYIESEKDIDQFIATAWQTAMVGWLIANPQIKTLNRNFILRAKTNKIYTLALAHKIGLDVNETHITNDLRLINSLLSQKSQIAKHLEGGRITEKLSPYDLDKLGSRLEFPFFVQEELVPPELRVFRIGNELFAYHIVSDLLDYRDDRNAQVIKVEIPAELGAKIIELTDLLHLDFTALDFKHSKDTGKPMLLEANSQPMFTAFDQVSDFQLVDSMIKFLTA